MKTDITLRSTFSNTSRIQRGAVALLLTAAFVFALILALQPTTPASASSAAVHQVVPAVRNPNRPVIGTGSAYDGSAYVEYLTGRSVASTPNVPVIGTGSAYDGGSYVTARPAVRNPNTPVQGTGSAYDGAAYITQRPAVRNPNMPVIGTGSAYDGQ